MFLLSLVIFTILTTLYYTKSLFCIVAEGQNTQKQKDSEHMPTDLITSKVLCRLYRSTENHVKKHSQFLLILKINQFY